ncbi:MAG: 5-methyltetrahydrofolate--homocysteine methyltransferase [Bacteroidaceae bacterium]|nr:5-methyltetrahydrofolate--homocysteine methyltransferase [Bacteroidaceae bacterium]
MTSSIHVIDFSPKTLLPYIDWAHFLFSWGVKGINSNHKEAEQLKVEALRLLRFLDETNCKAKAKVMVVHAVAHEDDIIVTHNRTQIVIPCLRQQKLDKGCNTYKCLADYIAPNDINHPVGNRLGVFATTFVADVDIPKTDSYSQMLLQTLSDRLAEAAAEATHLFALQHIWGMELNESPCGIRPAVGYPSLPDMSLNFVLNQLLDFNAINISLTPSGMMDPHASVSGLIFAHPRSAYFNVGQISVGQLADYAMRREISVEEMKKFICNIGEK